MPAGKGRHSPIAADDQGRAIAALLNNPAGHFGTTIPISGPVEMDHEQMAVELSEALGRKIVFENPSVDEYCASLETMGVPAYIIQHLSGAAIKRPRTFARESASGANLTLGTHRSAGQTVGIDPLLPFKIDPMNGREARESGLRLKV
jgi:uncharacterized protein YbjT (DUF2867 family)